MELLTAERCLHVSVARPSSRVYKDECIYSFDNPVGNGMELHVPSGMLQMPAWFPRGRRAKRGCS